MKRPLRLGISPITNQVYVGHMSDDESFWVGEKTDVTADYLRIEKRRSEYHPDDPTLPKLLAALGWQGGTVAQALEEVWRLKGLGEIVVMSSDDIEKIASPFCMSPIYKPYEKASWIGAAVHEAMNQRIRNSRTKPIGQGVAALLPEYGEAVCIWRVSGTLLRARCDDKHRGHRQRPEVCPYCGKPTVFV